MLVTLSVARSIDELAVALSPGFLRISVWLLAIFIRLVAALFGLLAMLLRRFLRLSMQSPADVLSGYVLVAMGVKILVDRAWRRRQCLAAVPALAFASYPVSLSCAICSEREQCKGKECKGKVFD